MIIIHSFYLFVSLPKHPVSRRLTDNISESFDVNERLWKQTNSDHPIGLWVWLSFMYLLCSWRHFSMRCRSNSFWQLKRQLKVFIVSLISILPTRSKLFEFSINNISLHFSLWKFEAQVYKYYVRYWDSSRCCKLCNLDYSSSFW